MTGILINFYNSSLSFCVRIVLFVWVAYIFILLGSNGHATKSTFNYQVIQEKNVKYIDCNDVRGGKK